MKEPQMHGFSLISWMNFFCKKSVLICTSVAKNMFFKNPFCSIIDLLGKQTDSHLKLKLIPNGSK